MNTSCASDWSIFSNTHGLERAVRSAPVACMCEYESWADRLIQGHHACVQTQIDQIASTGPTSSNDCPVKYNRALAVDL